MMKYVKLFENFGEANEDLRQKQEEIQQVVKMFISDKANAKMMIVTGEYGSGKLFATKEALKAEGLNSDEDFRVVGELSDAEDLEMVFNQKEFAGKIIVIDDSDDLMDDVDAVQILKGLADGGKAFIEDSHGKREIKLEGKGKVILIAKEAPDALIARSLHVKM